MGIEFFSICLFFVARRSSPFARPDPLSLSHTHTHATARSPGGYTKTNVARAWTLGTAAIVDEYPDNELPESRYRNFFGPENSLRWVSIRISTDTWPMLTRSLALRSFVRYNPPARFQDLNTKEDLVGILGRILDNLKQLYQAPGADLEVHPPDAFIPHATDPANEEIVHNRLTQYAQSHFVQYLRCVESGLADPFGSDLL